MLIYNTETKEVDEVNNKQAVAVIARTDGLWIEYREPVAKEQLPPIKKQVVKKKLTLKRK